MRIERSEIVGYSKTFTIPILTALGLFAVVIELGIHIVQNTLRDSACN